MITLNGTQTGRLYATRADRSQDAWSVWVVGTLFLALLFAGCAQDTRIDVSRMEDRVRDLLAIYTMEHVYRDVVYFGEEESFLFIPTVDRRVLFSVNIRVQAGIDLTDGIEVFRSEDDDSQVFVRLPPPEVLLVDADESSIHQYFVRERGGRVGWLEYGEQIEAIKRKNAEDAVERGILVRAAENARMVVRNFLELAGFESVVFLPGRPTDDGQDGEDNSNGGELRG